MVENILFMIKAVIMGIVEGITEFLPVSSTGHLIIAKEIINFQNPPEYVTMFIEVIQLGAILAIIVLYWDKIMKSLKNLLPGAWGFRLWSSIVVAAIPSGVLGILLKKKIEHVLMGTWPVAIAMIVGGFLLFFAENSLRGKYKTKNIEGVTYVQAIIVGCFQCLALWPGMSRSASTIIGGWMAGLSSFAAAEFSFFLGIPTMLGESGISLLKMHWSSVTPIEVISLAIGFIVSFVVALVVVEKFVNFLKRRSMRVFSVYRIAAGIVLVILLITKVM